MSPKGRTRSSGRDRGSGQADEPGAFTEEERAAMRERARELRTDAAGGETAVLEKIAEMPQPDRAMAERIHTIVRTAAPALAPRTWYGMPAYAKDGKVLCFFQSAAKFRSRYATFGFTDAANLDEGAMWPVSFALRELTPEVEARIRSLVEKAAG